MASAAKSDQNVICQNSSPVLKQHTMKISISNDHENRKVDIVGKDGILPTKPTAPTKETVKAIRHPKAHDLVAGVAGRRGVKTRGRGARPQYWRH